MKAAGERWRDGCWGGRYEVRLAKTADRGWCVEVLTLFYFDYAGKEGLGATTSPVCIAHSSLLLLDTLRPLSVPGYRGFEMPL